MLSSLSGYALRTTAAQYKVHENPRFLHNSPGGAAGNASEQDPAVGLHSLTVQALGSGQRSEIQVLHRGWSMTTGLANLKKGICGRYRHCPWTDCGKKKSTTHPERRTRKEKRRRYFKQIPMLPVGRLRQTYDTPREADVLTDRVRSEKHVTSLEADAQRKKKKRFFIINRFYPWADCGKETTHPEGRKFQLTDRIR